MPRKIPMKRKNIFINPGVGKMERRKLMLNEFKNFSAESNDLDELVQLAAFGRQFRAEHETLNVPVPEYVDDNLRGIRREIESKLADRKAARIRELKATRSSLATAAERREAIDRELEKLGEPVGA
jgi:hypothetical protein